MTKTPADKFEASQFTVRIERESETAWRWECWHPTVAGPTAAGIALAEDAAQQGAKNAIEALVNPESVSYSVKGDDLIERLDSGLPINPEGE